MRCSLHILILSLLAPCMALSAQGKDERPDILLVLFDDAGFMDFGAYGSDTATPTIDRLAQTGTSFTRYYTSPLCGPSRASLMTGQDSHLVGAGTLAEVLTDEMRALPAYSMTWANDQETIASRLQAAGYQTFVTGKWGIGDIGANLPHRFGFDRSWVLDSTGASNYQAKPYLPQYREVKWFEDGRRVDLPTDFYSSRNIVDKMIEYMDDADAARPVFAYLSFQAVHIPVQVPSDYIDRYNGVFDRGWEVMREERRQRAIGLGLVPATTRLSEGAYNDRDWDALPEEEKAYWARAMQTNAGMMEAADYHLGRLLDHLEATGRLDNTLIVITSDNGPEYNTLGKTSRGGSLAFEKAWLAIEGWDTTLENLGQPGSMAAIGHEWASVSAAPFHLFKFNASEGGLRVPMIISGPEIENRGFIDSRAQVSDLAPTLLEAAGVAYDPADFYGRSLVPVLEGRADYVYDETDSFAFEVSGNAALYRGDWKITRTLAPYGDGAWHLYDLSRDPGETTDVATQKPDIFRAMLSEYEAYEANVGAFKMAPGETARKQLTRNALKKSIVNYWYLFGALLLAVVLIPYALYRSARTLLA
jgi:arylsulfatase A-like enzyme